MKHFHIHCAIILNCLLTVSLPRLALAVQTQVTHVQGILYLAGPKACAQFFALPVLHAPRTQGGRSATIRLLDKHRNEVVTELAQLAAVVNQATIGGNFAEAKVLRRHLCRISTICATRFPEYCATLKRLSSG
jgi:hypothetical protein